MHVEFVINIDYVCDAKISEWYKLCLLKWALVPVKDNNNTAPCVVAETPTKPYFESFSNT